MMYVVGHHTKRKNPDSVLSRRDANDSKQYQIITDAIEKQHPVNRSLVTVVKNTCEKTSFFVFHNRKCLDPLSISLHYGTIPRQDSFIWWLSQLLL